MTRGPERGRALIKVNGKRTAAFDTGRDEPQHRTIVWQDSVRAGDRVRVVNRGTRGRPRIEVDAFIVRASSSAGLR